MVLESLLPVEKILERKAYAFVLGVLYSSLSITVSFYLFPYNFIVFAVALNSLLFLPLINKLLEKEKDIEKRTERFAPGDFMRDHKGILQVYSLLFVGITLSFALFTLFTPGIVLNHLFENQAAFTLSIYTDITALEFSDFWTIIGNNVKVGLVCYLAAFFLGTGAILIISWNASVWGTVMGAIAKNSALAKFGNPLTLFLKLSAVVMPYLIVEASAYFLAGIAGGIVSKAVTGERLFSKNFEVIIKKSLILLWISLFLILVGALLESYAAPYLFEIL